MAARDSGISVDSFAVNYDTFNEEEALRLFKEFGVLVVKNAFSDAYCDEKVNEIVSFFEGLGTGIDRNDAASFSGDGVPIETRPGMFQCLVGNLPAVWEIRKSPVFRRCFSALYQHEGQFICSSDGFTLTPNRAYPQPADWPHLDQTTEGTFRCVQGQAVLTNTSAAFVCSPKSHLIHEEVLELYQCRSKNNFLRLDGKVKKRWEVEKRLQRTGGTWQIPVVVPKGSLIFWASSTIHSARPTVTKEDNVSPADPWRGWRCAVYVCYRPVSEFTQQELATRAECLLKNRLTNHWGTKVFAKRPRGGARVKSNKHPIIEEMIKEPTGVYKHVKRPRLDDPVIRELSGVRFCESEDARLMAMMDVYDNPEISLDDKLAKLASFSEKGMETREFDDGLVHK